MRCALSGMARFAKALPSVDRLSRGKSHGANQRSCHGDERDRRDPRPFELKAEACRLGRAPRTFDEVGSIWPVAKDIKLDAVDLGQLPAEWSMAPGGDPSRVLIFFHGGGYCSGSILSHRRM